MFRRIIKEANEKKKEILNAENGIIKCEDAISSQFFINEYFFN